MQEPIDKIIDLLKITCRAYFGTDISATGDIIDHVQHGKVIQIKIIPESYSKTRYLIGRNGTTSRALQTLITTWGIMQGYPRIWIYIVSKKHE